MDLQSLNNQTIKYSYRLPPLENILDQLAGARFFSCLSLRNWVNTKQLFQYQVLNPMIRIVCALDGVMHQVHST